MLSATSSSEKRPSLRGWFNPTLFKKNITRFWPLWAGYTAIWFFVIPMELITLGIDKGRGRPLSAAAAERVTQILSNASLATVFMGAVFGVLVAMALFSYLMNPRSSQMLHALPIRREGLMLTNWLSGLWFSAVPGAVITLLSGAVALLYDLPVFPDVLLWFLIQTVVSMFFCFAVCCAMFTGHILALPIFYGILNLLVVGALFLVDLTMQLLLVGYSGLQAASTTFARWCTPGYQLIYLLGRRYTESTSLYFQLSDPVAAICYCVVLGAVFTFIAVMVYRYRQLERAGDLVTVGWVRPVFQYGFGTCVGFALGYVLYHNFFEGVWSFIILVVACAVLGAFAGRMLLKKTLRVFAEGWKGVAVFAAVLLVLLGGARADLFGYQRWVPAVNKVESVEVSTVGSYPHDGGRYSTISLTDPEDITTATAFHTALVADLKRLEGMTRLGDTWYEGKYVRQGFTSVRIAYYMADGSMEVRRYPNVEITADELAREGTYANLLQELLNRPRAVEEAYMGQLLDAESVVVTGGWLANIKQDEIKEVPITVDDGVSPGAVAYEAREYGEQPLSQEEAQELWNAVQADLAAGDIGRRYLLEDRQRYENCYQTDLIFTVSARFENREGQRSYQTQELHITVQNSAGRTLAALEKMGYGGLLLPWDMEE